MPSRPYLLALADELGILREYRDTRGRCVRAPDSTRTALVAALGYEASTERKAKESLARMHDRSRRRLVDPVSVQVLRERSRPHLLMRLPDAGDGGRWRVTITLETGEAVERTGTLRSRSPRGAPRIPLPAGLPPGYHDLVAHVRVDGKALSGRQKLILVPPTCWTWREALAERRAWGLWAHVYTLSRRRNWGIGDLTDLRHLAEWAGSCGAQFVGINPLHALSNRGDDISPYSPVSRLFRNPIYLDVESVPEFRNCREARRFAGSKALQTASNPRAQAIAGWPVPQVEYEHVFNLKIGILRRLFAEFQSRHMGGSTARGRAYARFVRDEGELLTSFAVFTALAERHGPRGGPPRAWRRWPAEFQDHRSRAVESFSLRHADEVEFHRFLQFEMDRQLAAADAAARRRGAALGLFHDLAVGSSGGGFDTWAFQASGGDGGASLFVDDITMGAPPDPLAREGQDWNFPPLHPLILKETGYEYWRRALRASMRHGGMLRIDHVLGLFRQFWIPHGMTGRDGAYVRFPAEDLMGIAALESRRNKVVLVGEDLGTVPPEVPRELRRRGLLSTRVLYFERTPRGAYRRPRGYSDNALVVAHTHDLPPLSDFTVGSDLWMLSRLRSPRGARRRPTPRQLEARLKNVDELFRRLSAEGLLPPGLHARALTPAVKAPSLWDIVIATYTFLARTHSPLLAVSLQDLLGESGQLNYPGVPPDSGLCWTLRSPHTIEDIRSMRTLREALKRIGRVMRHRSA